MGGFIYGVLLLVLGVRGQGILYPRESESREVKSLNGIWEFRSAGNVDQEIGFQNKWFTLPLSQTGEVEMMPVPSSFNDITQDKALRDHVGWVWYSTSFWVPKSWKSKNLFLRFGSANYFSVLWVNGNHVLNHTGGYLPFKGDITSMVNFGAQNLLVLALNNTLGPETIPQGTLQYPNDTTRYPKGFTIQTYNFDYFNFAGIHRPVYLYTTPATYIDDITLDTNFHHHDGTVSYSIEYKSYFHLNNSVFANGGANCLVVIRNKSGVKVANGRGCHGEITIPKVQLWWPYLSEPEGEPPGYLYTFETRLINLDEPEDVDVYSLKFGVRTVKVVNDTFLVNRRPFYFRGFGRHEDYNIRGRGVDPVMLVKDHNLIKWTGANSYRTSHYPYAEEILDLTDQLGIVIIDESPAIGLTGFKKDLMNSHIQVMKDLVQRDKNRPSVLMWSIGNEPKSMEELAPSYFDAVINATRKADNAARPITIVLSQNFSKGIAPSLDVISINRYFGWYGDTGRTEVIHLQMPREVELWYKSYRKPVLVTEYGAGTVAGMHQSPSFVWTEDYQTDYLLQHFRAFDQLRETSPYFIGEMIWNFADFATPEETFRPWGCMKGIFTRERQPKRAAHLVRLRYWTLAQYIAKTTNTSILSLPEDLYLLNYFSTPK